MEYPEEKASKLEKINLGDKFEIKYVVRNRFQSDNEDLINDKAWLYVSYKNKEGWVDGRTIALKNEIRYAAEFDDFYLYSEPNKEKKTEIKVSFGTPLEIDYVYDRFLFIFTDVDDMKWYRVKYKNQYYWINRFSDIYGYPYEEGASWGSTDYTRCYWAITKDKNLNVYNEPKSDSEQKKVVLEDKLIFKIGGIFKNARDGKEYLYVNTKNISGWILKSDAEGYDGEIPDDLKDGDKEKEDNFSNEIRDDKENNSSKGEKKVLSPMEMAILCVIEAVIICLLGIFGFVYVRNKKKSKIG